MIRAIAGAASALVFATLVLLRLGYVLVLIEGDGMETMLRPGQWVLVRRTRTRRIWRGRVVVLAFPPGRRPTWATPPWLVTCVAAAPGDPVPRETVPALRHVPGQRIPPGRLVLLSGNRTSRYDSRRVGCFAAGTLLGVVVGRDSAV